MSWFDRSLVLLGLYTCVAACGSDSPNEDDSASGFTDSSNSVGETSGTVSGDATTTGNDGPSSGYDTLGEGDLRGILTFTLYPSDALNEGDIVGMAGAWRDAGVGFEAIDDFFAIWGLGTEFPQPAAEADTLEQNDIPVAFDWGSPDQWLLAGNAMKLTGPTTAASACLFYAGGSAEVEFPPGSGTLVPNFPIYAATGSALQPEECAPDPAAWLPATEYELVLYGGERFETNALEGQVHTPPAFDVIKPSLATYADPLDGASALDVVWEGDGEEGNRIVIRVWDSFGRMLTVHAADDGNYTIPAAQLDPLDRGPITMTIARENIEHVPFTDGVVKVVTRFERWGYLDLF